MEIGLIFGIEKFHLVSKYSCGGVVRNVCLLKIDLQIMCFGPARIPQAQDPKDTHSKELETSRRESMLSSMQMTT